MEINVQLRDEDSEKIVLGTIITERNEGVIIQGFFL